MELVPMTQKGYDQMRAKLDKLKNVEMPRLEKALGDAREMGDLSENSEFETARHEIWITEQQIAELEDKVARAQIVAASEIVKDKVGIGALVKVEDLDKKYKDEFLIVGEGETRKDVDCVSSTSPLGQAILGKKIGEVAEVEAPRGRIRYKVLGIKVE